MYEQIQINFKNKIISNGKMENNGKKIENINEGSTVLRSVSCENTRQGCT